MELPENIEIVLSRIEQAGFEGFLVGGCVRDWLRGEKPHDFDITTNAKPEETMALFSDFPIIEAGLQHGTVAVVMDRQPIEITTYRIETTYSDHRHPDAVKFAATLEEDLSRRDFTINAMAMDRKGILMDPFGGKEDLQNRIIRCVGCARERFSEDALRILRALRFAARFGFKMEKETKAALFERAPLLKEIAAERILTELKGILMAENAAEILLEYEPILKEVLPALEADSAILNGLPQKEAVRFAGWLWKMGGEARAVFRALKASNSLMKKALSLIEGQQARYQPNRREMIYALACFGEDLEDHLALLLASSKISERSYREALYMADQLRKEAFCLSLKDLAIGGKELQAEGFSGAAIGRMLDRLLEEVLEERLSNEREALLSFAKNHEK